MKQISTSLASKLKQDTIVERDYIIFSGETTRHYIWFNLYDDCYNNGNFIGTFVMKRVEFTYKDSDLEFKNKEFNAYKEYKLDSGTWESIDYGTFIVQAVEESDTKEEIKVTAYDYGLKFANTYKTDLDYASGKVTLFQVLQEICQKVGVELENTSIENGDFIVDSNQFAEGSLFGNVITAIAQMSCNFAKITSENKLKLLFKNESDIIIDTKDYEEFEDKRDTQPYNAVSLGLSDIEGENVTLVAQGVDPDEAKYLTINDNPFAYTQDKRTQLIQAIFDKINGFGYSSFVLKNCLYPQLECGDLIQIRNKEEKLIDSIVLRPTFEETALNFEAPSTITSTVSYVQPLSAIETAKRAERKVDKQNLIISDVVSEVGQYDNRITSVEQSVDKIEQQVNEAITLIKDVDGSGSISLENTSNNNLYKLSIKGDISLLFGNDGKQYGQPQFFREDLYFREDLLFTEGVPLADPLYPSSNLFGKNMNLIIEYKEDDKEVYKLPFSYLNYLSQEVADEFILEDGKAKIIRRVGINSSMQKYELPNEVLEELGDFTIPLKEGNPKIYLQCFDSAIYNATYMIKNAYTEEFATKVELNSSITQLSNDITLEVNGKIDTLDEDINAKLELKVDTKNLVSEINASADKINLTGDRIIIDSTNLKVAEDGTLTATNGEFTGTINGGTINGSSINTDKNLTVGNNFYVGQNQSTEAVDLKYMYFDNENYIRRSKTSFFNIIEMHSQQRSSMFAGNDSNNAQIITNFLDNSPTIYLSFTVNNTQRSVADFSNDYIRFLHQPTIMSDKRLKKNIKDIEVNWIKDLKVKQFEYKNDIIKNKYIGLVAQEYQDKDYAKYFLDKDEKGFYSINYGNITNALIKYVQQLEKRIEVLENENIRKN